MKRRLLRSVVLIQCCFLLTFCGQEAREVEPNVSPETLAKIEEIKLFAEGALSAGLNDFSINNPDLVQVTDKIEQFAQESAYKDEMDSYYASFYRSTGYDYGRSSLNSRAANFDVSELSKAETQFLLDMLNFIDSEPSVEEVNSYLADVKDMALHDDALSSSDAASILLMEELSVVVVETIQEVVGSESTSGRVSGNDPCLSQGVIGGLTGAVIGFAGGCGAGVALTWWTGPGALAGCVALGIGGAAVGGAAVAIGSYVICATSNTYQNPFPPADQFDLSSQAHLLKQDLGVRLTQLN